MVFFCIKWKVIRLDYLDIKYFYINQSIKSYTCLANFLCRIIVKQINYDMTYHRNTRRK